MGNTLRIKKKSTVHATRLEIKYGGLTKNKTDGINIILLFNPQVINLINY